MSVAEQREGAQSSFAREEARVEAHEAALKRELGLTDLVLTQVMYVVGTTWVGTAAKLGQAQIVYWLTAIVLFYIPQAAVVIYLNRRMPLEGGLYQWAKLGFNEMTAFLVAWNLWLYAIALISTIGLIVTSSVAYAIGPSGAWLAESKGATALVSGGLIGAMVLVAILGLGVGKWVHNAGSAMLLAAFAILIGLPFLGLARGTVRAYHPFAVALPAVSLFSLNILGKMGAGALSGFEYVAMLAGECKDPARTIGRSVVIAAPVIALMFILGTSAVMAFVPIGSIDLIAPIPQVFRVGFGGWGIVGVVVPVTILFITARTIANTSMVFTGTTRMPMVAGWDALLPEWFARLHPRYRTPVNSVLFIGAVAIVLALAGNLGVGAQEAFQVLENAAGIFYAFTYLVMFALPLVAFRDAADRPSGWLRLAAASGFAMTALYTVLSVLPIVTVKSPFAFAAKVGGMVAGANVVGAAVFLGARRKRDEE